MGDRLRSSAPFSPTDAFAPRHIGPHAQAQRQMLDRLGLPSLDALIEQVLPEGVLSLPEGLEGPDALGEYAAQRRLRAVAAQNRVLHSLIGMGYSPTVTPPVIQRNILENPGWYTQYTPYQAEIAQGRLEALVNFQTLVADLTGLPLANASLLDEGTAAAEAMNLCLNTAKRGRDLFFAARDCHPQTLAVLRTRAEPLDVELVIGDVREIEQWLAAEPALAERLSGVLVQYPGTAGEVYDWRGPIAAIQRAGAKVVMACDLLALTLLPSPGALGADIAVGSSQRFGVPLGFGGPHAAFFATHDAHRRQIPGRIVGVSVDVHGQPAYRLALQTREQHIRRDRATSNICTSQVLLAIMASMYAVYHGPEGLTRIARRIKAHTELLARALRHLGFEIPQGLFFDTFTVSVRDPEAIHARAVAAGYNLRRFEGEARVGLSLDERCDLQTVRDLIAVFSPSAPAPAAAPDLEALGAEISGLFEGDLARTEPFLTHPVFNRYHTEHELLRYMHRLQAKDLSLTTSMIPLGSCTMKLNATSEMLPISWPEFADLHPFVPADQSAGYRQLFAELEGWLAHITGFEAVSLQPNAGSQGEFAGLLTIRAWHRAQGQPQRTVCLIPTSAHGTNPASAVMAGFKVVAVRCDERGDVDLADLEAKAAQYADTLGALMITYPSTHGVFEAKVRQLCEVVHRFGGQVYMDGANLNAQLGLCRPGDLGADVCHLNLHKTFAIPHGGGGPGVGPIGVAAHLAPFLPGHPVVSPVPEAHRQTAIGPVSAAPWGSAGILPISHSYIALMGADGLRRATQVAILNANYMAARLEGAYPLVYAGENGRVGHEFIINCAQFKSVGVTVDDIAKRLMDYGFHAPTMSFPVANTLMIEPTESESQGELDRLCEALLRIREEIRDIEAGRASADDNPLKNAPHTAAVVSADAWPHSYSRAQAAWPAPWLREHKYWPTVGRVDNAYGDRNLMCTCPPMESYEETPD